MQDLRSSLRWRFKSCLSVSIFTLKMEAARSSEMLISYHTASQPRRPRLVNSWMFALKYQFGCLCSLYQKRLAHWVWASEMTDWSLFCREMRSAVSEALVGRRGSEDGDKVDRSLVASFDILNLVPEKSVSDYDTTPGAREPEGKSLIHDVCMFRSQSV